MSCLRFYEANHVRLLQKKCDVIGSDIPSNLKTGIIFYIQSVKPKFDMVVRV